MLLHEKLTFWQSVKGKSCVSEPKTPTNVVFCFTFPQSSPARNFYQRSGHRPPRSGAGPAACARPAGWTHLGACSRWVSTVPCPCCRPSRTAISSVVVDVCVSPERTAGSNTSDQRRQTVGWILYYFTVIHLRRYRAEVTVTVTAAAAATTTHALRTITSHTVRWTINVTTGGSRSKTYGRKRSFVRIRMIVRMRARTRACVSFFGVCVCVCACACGGKWRRLQSNGPALSDSDEWHRPGTSGAERGCRSTSRCSAHERARIQTNPERCGPNAPKSGTLPSTQTTLPETISRGPVALRSSSVACTVGLEFIIRIAWFSPGKIPKTEDPESKTFRNGKRNTVAPNTMGLRSKTVLRGGGGGRTAVVVTPVRVRTGGRARHAPPPAYWPPLDSSPPTPTTTRSRGGRKKLSRRRRWRRHRTKLCFTHDDDDPLSIPFSLFRISARGACCCVHVIISATREILAPHSLHNDYYYYFIAVHKCIMYERRGVRDYYYIIL